MDLVDDKQNWRTAVEFAILHAVANIQFANHRVCLVVLKNCSFFVYSGHIDFVLRSGVETPYTDGGWNRLFPGNDLRDRRRRKPLEQLITCLVSWMAPCYNLTHAGLHTRLQPLHKPHGSVVLIFLQGLPQTSMRNQPDLFFS